MYSLASLLMIIAVIIGTATAAGLFYVAWDVVAELRAATTDRRRYVTGIGQRIVRHCADRDATR